MCKIFISYPRPEVTRVALIRRELENAGCDVFVDTLIPASDDFRDRLDKELRTSTAVLGCWTKDAFSKKWCMSECAMAREMDKLIPAKIGPFDATDVHLEFVRLNYIDLSDFDGDPMHVGWRKLLSTIDHLAGDTYPRATAS